MLCDARLGSAYRRNRKSAVAKFCLRLTVLTLIVFFLLGASSAFAWYESKPSTPGATVATSTAQTTDPLHRGCPDCHGLDAGVTSPTVTQSRKGPHGNYTTGTQKCTVCHTIHDAANSSLLPAATVQATCNTCHDGTGGGGVYGVIYYRTGIQPVAQHSLDASSVSGGWVTVPGGDASTGGSVTTTFTGVSGGLTCSDCHNPHDSNCVTPFVGDRRRSIGDTQSAVATDRLLRKVPLARWRSNIPTPTAYGSDWCEVCHPGRMDGTVNNHPSDDHSTDASTTSPNDAKWNYSNVIRVTGYNTSAVTSTGGPLGGNNFGYVMPDNLATPSGRGNQPYPICQQCHEDARAVGDATQFQINSTTESFSVSVDGYNSGVAGGNPRFTTFPHEGTNASFLIETGDDLCLNCHSAPN